MFRMNLKEYRRQPVLLSDYLPWSHMPAATVIQLKQPALMRVLEYRGHDLQSMATGELAHVSSVFNRAVASLGEGFSLHMEAARRPMDPLGVMPIAAPAAQIVEQRRVERASGPDRFETRYFITLTYLPGKVDTGGLVKRFANLFGGLFEGKAQEVDGSRLDVEQFLRRTDEFGSFLLGVMDEMVWLDGEALLSFLHSTCSDSPNTVHMPAVPMFLDAIIGQSDLEIGTKLRLGKFTMRCVSIKGYPDQTHPQILDSLRDINCSWRWVTRFLGLSQDEAMTVLQTRSKMSPGALDEIMKNVQEGRTSIGYHSSTMVVWDLDAHTCDKLAQHIQGVFNRSGFSAVIETANSCGSWLGSLPGHVWSNPRRSPIESIHLSHCVTLGADWAGDAQSTHLGLAPHVHCISDTGAPYRLNLNVGDVGHTMILGPTGSGKSVLLGLLEMQWMKYPDARVIIFDKGRSARAATLAMGGKFIELGLPEQNQVVFQPLRHMDDQSERVWAAEWLESILESEGYASGPNDRQALRQALERLGHLPVHLRTMTQLLVLLQHRSMTQALSPYTHGQASEHAWLWDNNTEHLDDSHWLAFEMSHLMESSPRTVSAVLQYLFHRLQQRFDGSPTLLVLDEAWVFLDNPAFSKRLRQWLKELRKYRVYVIFATQEIADALNSDIAPTLLQNCPTKILLPNPQAVSETFAPAYKTLGLSSWQTHVVASALNKRQYYLHNSQGSRLFDLGLGHMELALIGASTPQDHLQIDQVLKYAKPGAQFAQAWFDARGVELSPHERQLLARHAS